MLNWLTLLNLPYHMIFKLGLVCILFVGPTACVAEREMTSVDPEMSGNLNVKKHISKLINTCMSIGLFYSSICSYIRHFI